MVHTYYIENIFPISLFSFSFFFSSFFFLLAPSFSRTEHENLSVLIIECSVYVGSRLYIYKYLQRIYIFINYAVE
ncbi:hypothetical protein F4810DRAFT_683769 [Camillea tinctor]|nr:hypothetical protein F4810DRAFT_683769 [Camillea tinctor]